MGNFFSSEYLRGAFDLANMSVDGHAAGGDSWLRRTRKPIYFFGAGYYGRMLADDLRLRGYGDKLKGFLDNNPGLAGKEIDSIPVFHPAHPKAKGENPFVFITIYNGFTADAVAEDCRRLGYECVRRPDFSPAWNAYANALLLARIENNPRTVAALDIWADNESRETYRRAVVAMATGNIKYLPDVPEHPQYFPPFLGSDRYRSFVDGGAYCGDTLRMVREFTGGGYDRYYAFEPSKENMARLSGEAGNDDRVSLYSTVLWSGAAALPFYGKYQTSVSSAAHVAPETDVGEGVELLEADSLDAVLGDAPVSMIKLDIEGSEMRALEGARGVIGRHKPALTICMYHKLEHLWEIPLWIRDLDLGYELRCRHYSRNTSFETVCYAIPAAKHPEDSP